ncbi:hypothetical protein T265_01250 [Opisthorchis viverrini]|uniref:Uncharacterized protein n=1 Tax=Opisthorchis viverrini TaxID=6198 RepID=A0A075A3D8_OPIVI|nr:hypothetical protein T265_01250 [Opisthorchis viverrini]KER32767.1 hypothetical protein T265_01250 [Opisthorchis viverrini]
MLTRMTHHSRGSIPIIAQEKNGYHQRFRTSDKLDMDEDMEEELLSSREYSSHGRVKHVARIKANCGTNSLKQLMNEEVSFSRSLVPDI